VDRLTAGGAVAHARDPNLPEQRQHRASVAPFVGQPQRPLRARDDDRLPDVTVAAGVDVRLQRKPQELAAAAL